jgi:hypothetical protein
MPQNYGALERVLRVGEGRRVKKLADQAAYITSLEPDFEALSDEELAAKTASSPSASECAAATASHSRVRGMPEMPASTQRNVRGSETSSFRSAGVR